MSNLELWSKVSETDVTHTKKAQKGMYSFTAIAPMSQFKKATEVFGIQGIGWGVKPDSENFHERIIGETVLLNYDAVLFFKYGGDTGEVAIHATEKLCYKTQGKNSYLKIDDEARKKVVTNAKTKGLSELGFNADVFMGMFDDHDYFNEIAIAQSNEKANAKDEANDKKFSIFKEEFNTFLNKLSESENIATLNQCYKLYEKKIKRSCSELKKDVTPYLNKLTEVGNETKTKLNEVK